MARKIYRLNEKLVRLLEAPGYRADGGGLYLQISKASTKSWIFRFCINGRTRDMGLGSVAAVSLAAARSKATERRAMVARGIDPIEHAKTTRLQTTAAFDVPSAPAGPTFREFAISYVGARADTWRSAKHGAQWLATLEAYAFPVIGDMALATIDTPDILRILEPIWGYKSETASRVRGRIERILAAAAVRGLRPATNPATWVGHLREALPPKQKGGSFAAMPYPAVPTFLELLRQRDGVGAAALEFTILTAARSGEARGALWSEIDEPAALWTVPPDRMKSGRAHVVPLSEAALAILVAVKPLRDLTGGFIFPGVKSGKPLSDMTLSKLVHAMGFDVTVHGFRASFKTWAEQETDHANVVIEAALAHVVGDKAERAYMRGDWLAKRRVLMEAWGKNCTSNASGNVLEIPSAVAA